ncbi:MAG: AAA family ATPase [bacterium]|nr:AAA family ATPase [bacterium]
MYIKSAHIKGIKCFENIDLEFKNAKQTGDPQSNWNVILGDNGDGKTTLLRAIAAGLMDAATAERLLDMKNLIREKESTASILVKWLWQQGDQLPDNSKNGDRKKLTVHYLVAGEGSALGRDEQAEYFSSARIIDPTSVNKKYFSGDSGSFDKISTDLDFLKRNVWKMENIGWISCGYGPFRRAVGPSTDTIKIEDQLQERFLTLFHEGAALTECESWLKDLERRALKGGKDSGQKKIFNEAMLIIKELLPNVDEIIIEDTVLFKWRGSSVSLRQLSDGYRSMFVFIVDMLHWFEKLKLPETGFREVNGVVLIDEIDAHLHPHWQRKIGFELIKIFPNIQFIVTTHSPFVAMAAGTGALTVLEKIKDDAVTANRSIESPRGWAVDRVLTNLFGMESLRDQDTAEKLIKYDELILAQQSGEISVNEIKELDKLKSTLNERLMGEWEAPKNKQLEKDLAFFARSYRKKMESEDA